jgi:hypothetical protein
MPLSLTLQLNPSVYNKIVIMMQEVVVTQCVDKTMHALGTGSTNSVGRRICEQCLLPVVNFMKRAYLGVLKLMFCIFEYLVIW